MVKNSIRIASVAAILLGSGSLSARGEHLRADAPPEVRTYYTAAVAGAPATRKERQRELVELRWTLGKQNAGRVDGHVAEVAEKNGDWRFPDGAAKAEAVAKTKDKIRRCMDDIRALAKPGALGEVKLLPDGSASRTPLAGRIGLINEVRILEILPDKRMVVTVSFQAGVPLHMDLSGSIVGGQAAGGVFPVLPIMLTPSQSVPMVLAKSLTPPDVEVGESCDLHALVRVDAAIEMKLSSGRRVHAPVLNVVDLQAFLEK